MTRRLVRTPTAEWQLDALDDAAWQRATELIAKYESTGTPKPIRVSTSPALTLIISDPPIVIHLVADFPSGTVYVTRVINEAE